MGLIKYIIITSSGDPEEIDLMTRVNELIEEGYSPLGGVSVNYDRAEGIFIFAQAMLFNEHPSGHKLST